MGSITSRPSAPQPVAPTIVYNYAPPEPVYTPPPPPAPLPPPGPPPEGEPDISEEARSAARSEGLLNRNRGLLETVLTGFRGLLGQPASGARKTLLGE